MVNASRQAGIRPGIMVPRHSLLPTVNSVDVCYLASRLEKLTFNLPLNKLWDDSNGVECTIDVHVQQGVGCEDESEAFLFDFLS